MQYSQELMCDVVQPNASCFVRLNDAEAVWSPSVVVPENPFAPTWLDNKPFGKHVEGLS